MISKVTLLYLLLVIVIINITDAKFTEVPPPPPRPDHFKTKEELKQYLQKLHEYHLIIGRWRLRRDSINTNSPSSHVSNDDLFKFFDMNSDHYISNNEFAQRLKYKEEK